jgi:uncharacterized protein (TIGR03083 family)
MSYPTPILCAPLIRRVDEALLDLLRSLEPADWDRPTVAGSWTVRDVAAHLLDTQLRKLSLVRDHCFVEHPHIHSEAELVAFINRVNHEGVAVYRRLSPAFFLPLLERAAQESADFHEALDPFAPAAFPVSWAGESHSLNWFDTARELTERWHHQQQIRLATGRPGLLQREFQHPVLDCFLRALPHAYRHLDAPEGATVTIDITGDAGDLWVLQRASGRWTLIPPPGPEPSCLLLVPQAIAWRLFTKGIARAEAAAHIDIAGDASLAEPALRLTAIVG